MVRLLTDAEWAAWRRRHGHPVKVRLSDEAVRTWARILAGMERSASETEDAPRPATRRRRSGRLAKAPEKEPS
jgi:hypothetical protein